MADYTVDLSAIATANPWTPSAPLKKGSTANLQLVNGSGAKSASGGSVSYGVHDVNYTLGSTQIRAEVDIGTIVFASDRVGPAIIARSGANAGAGYAALPDNYGGIYVYTVSAAGALTQIGYIGSITLAANDLIGLGYQQSTNTLTVYQNGTSKTTVTDSTYNADTTLGAGWLTDPQNINAQYAKRLLGTGVAATAATISSPTPSGTLATSTTATIGGTTNQASGTAYTSLDQTQTNVTTATDANIKAGQIVGGTAAQASGNASVSSTTMSIPITGLGAGVLYYYSEIQNNTNGDSNRISGSFTTLEVANYTEQQKTTTTVTTSTTGTITFSSAPILGELLVATIAQNSGTTTITPPSGWTSKNQIAPTSRRLAIFWKIAGASEPTSYDFTFSAAVSAGICARRLSPQSGYSWSATQTGDDVSVSSDSAVSSVSTTDGSSNIGNLYVAVGYSANTNASNKVLLPDYGWTSSSLLYSSRSRHAIRSTSGVQQIFGYSLSDAATDTRNAFLMAEFTQYASAPAISSIDDSTPNYLGSLVITGNASALPFPTSQSGSAGITIDGAAQTVTWNTTTSCSIASISRGASKYGTSVNIILTDASGNASPNYSTTLSPQSGWAYVDTTGTLATAGDRITAVADIASGDQIVYGNVQGGTIADVTVYEDGSFTYNAGVTAFDVEINDGTGFSSAVTQTIAAASTAVGGIARALSSSPTRAITSAPT